MLVQTHRYSMYDRRGMGQMFEPACVPTRLYYSHAVEMVEMVVFKNFLSVSSTLVGRCGISILSLEESRALFSASNLS